MTKNGTIELMAPAGDFTSMQAALDNGADSVYFGVEQLNMRARASMNFTIDDLPEISRRCTEKGVRTYLTLNTIIYDHDLSLIKILLDKAKASNITAVIAMDQAVIAYARQIGDGNTYFYSDQYHKHRNGEVLFSFCRYNGDEP